MLREIRDYISEHGQVDMWTLKNRFSTDPDALRPMLDVLIRNGEIEKSHFQCGSCSLGSCAGCGSQLLSEIYQRAGKGACVPLRD